MAFCRSCSFHACFMAFPSLKICCSPQMVAVNSPALRRFCQFFPRPPRAPPKAIEPFVAASSIGTAYFSAPAKAIVFMGATENSCRSDASPSVKAEIVPMFSDRVLTSDLSTDAKPSNSFLMEGMFAFTSRASSANTGRSSRPISSFTSPISFCSCAIFPASVFAISLAKPLTLASVFSSASTCIVSVTVPPFCLIFCNSLMAVVSKPCCSSVMVPRPLNADMSVIV